jgi:hypothetical protein
MIAHLRGAMFESLQEETTTLNKNAADIAYQAL